MRTSATDQCKLLSFPANFIFCYIQICFYCRVVSQWISMWLIIFMRSISLFAGTKVYEKMNVKYGLSPTWMWLLSHMNVAYLPHECDQLRVTFKFFIHILLDQSELQLMSEQWACSNISFCWSTLKHTNM